MLLSISAPLPPHAVLGVGRDKEASHPPLYILTASSRRRSEIHWAYGAFQRGTHQKSNSKSPSLRDTTDITSATSVGNAVLAFYLSPLRDVQSPVKGQGDRMLGSEGELHAGITVHAGNCFNRL